MKRVVIVMAVLATAGGMLAGCGQAPTTGQAPRVPPAVAGSAESLPAPDGSAAREIDITVRNGRISGESGRVQVPLGTRVTVSVRSDIADEIHLHGYDREAAIPTGGVGSISFIADIPGVFEVELHESGRQLLQLQVG